MRRRTPRSTRTDTLFPNTTRVRSRASLPILIGDYVANDFTRGQLADFDALVFAAGNDIRHIEKDADEAAHWQRANIHGVPRFFRLAREAGIRRAVLVGSF